MDKLELIFVCLKHILQLIGEQRNGLIINRETWKVHFAELKNTTWLSWSRETPFYYKDMLESLDVLVIATENNESFSLYFEEGYIVTIPLKSDSVVIAMFYGDTDKLQDAFKMIWRRKIANAFLVTENLQVYTYSPVSKCSLDVVRLGQCSDVGVVSKQTTNYGFNKCTLDVLVSTNRPFTNGFNNKYSLETSILKVLSEKLDFNLSLTCDPCDNSGFMYNFLPENDVLAGGQFISHPEEFSAAYYQSQSEYSFYLPVASPIPHWKMIFYIFDGFTWIAILATLICLAAISYKEFRRIDSAIAHVLSLLLTNTCLVARKLKILFVLWSAAALLFTSSYSGLLVSFMCKEIPDQQVSTFEDIVAHNYLFGAVAFDIVKANPTIFSHPKSGKIYRPCSTDSWDCYNKLQGGRFGYFTSTYKIMHQMSYNKSHIWHKSPTIYTTYMAYHFRRFSPYLDKMQEYLTYIAESGILSKLDEYTWKSRKSEASVLQVFSLEHVYFAFFMYAMCIIVSVAVFVAELCMGMIFSYIFVH